MKRRAFLKTTAAGAALLTTGPLILGAEDKGGTKKAVVGSGEHKYECDHQWGELPASLKWQTTHNVAVDADGLVYITHQGLGTDVMDTVVVFDPKGKFVRSFGKEWHKGGHGIEIRKEGSEQFIYLSNTWTPTLKLVKTNLKGEVVWKKGRPECKEYEKPEVPYNPTNICFLSDGGFVVGDGYGSHYMLKYDKDAKLVKVFGGKGKTLGKLETPHGQWVDDRTRGKEVLLVCDRANHRLQTFTLDGEPIAATKPDEVVLFPAHAKTRGDVLLLPDLHARVSLFDKDLKPIVHLGEDVEWRKKVLTANIRAKPNEWVDGKFVHPHDACFDRDGNIFVVEWVATGRVSLLRRVS